VSHLAAFALDDGRSFTLRAVEVDLQLVKAELEFK
jgi:hypothetical protein